MNLLTRILYGSAEDGTATTRRQHDHAVLSARLAAALLVRLTNCRVVLEDGEQAAAPVTELWVQNGVFVEAAADGHDADLEIDCDGRLIAPGFIDVQLNGAFGRDFTADAPHRIDENVRAVAEAITRFGVTAFCPTIVSTAGPAYAALMPRLARSASVRAAPAACVLGAHLEGPFISADRPGAHDPSALKSLADGVASMAATYGDLDALAAGCALVTLAPELDPSGEVMRELKTRGVVVSIGHTNAGLEQAREALRNGATCITHLYNAMAPFHHREPGLLGLLASASREQQLFYGIIADGVHVHPSAIAVAYKLHPTGLVLVSDAIAPAGLDEASVHVGPHHEIEVVCDEQGARGPYVKGTRTLCGSVATLDECVRNLRAATGCSSDKAVACAGEHPARLLGVYPRKGSLRVGADADFVVLDDELHVEATFVGGDLAWAAGHWSPLFKYKLVPERV